MRLLAGIICALLVPSVASATTRKVYTSGTNSGGTYDLSHLQTAIDDAAQNDACGSEILLEQNATFSAPDGGFVLRQLQAATPAWDCLTIRTGVDSSGNLLSSSLFPAANTRMTTGYRSVLATFLPTVNNSAAIRTVYPGETGAGCSSAPCVGSGWTLKWIEVGPKIDWAQRPLLRFGTNTVGKEWNGSCTYPDATPACWNTVGPGGETQDMLTEVPRYLTLIQSDIHGDAFVGQQVGLFLSCRDARVLHNSFTDIKTTNSSDGYGIGSANGIGPFDVENNLIEGSTENFILGGSDSYLHLQATITGSPTTTSVTLSSPVWVHPELTTTAANLSTDMYSGIFISITHAGHVYSGMTCALSGSTCTLSPAMPVTPSAGDLVQWNWVHGGLTFKYNWSLKPLAWMNPAIPTPSGLIATPGTGGSLTAGSHCYQYIEWALVAGDGDIYSSPSTEVCATTGAGGKVTLTWGGESHATHYWVYGNGTTGTESQYWDVTAPTTTYVDTGAAGSAGTTNFTGTLWLVKNNFELKGCEGAGPQGPCLIEGNVFDNSWCCSQNNAITLKLENHDGNDVSQTLRNMTFSYNWVRHMNRAIAIVTSADGQPSGVMTDVMVTNNLFTDLSTAYANIAGDVDNSAIFLTTSNYQYFVASRGCVRCTLAHNSFFANSDSMKGPIWFNLTASGDTSTDFVLRDNIMARDCVTGGCLGNGTSSLKTYVNDTNQGQGTAAWNAAVAGSSFADHNAWPDGGSGTYTAGPFTNSFFVADATLKATHLTNYTNCTNDTDILGCALLNTSSLYHAASDSTDVGANIGAIKSFTDIVLSGVQAQTTGGRPRTRLRLRGGGL